MDEHNLSVARMAKQKKKKTKQNKKQTKRPQHKAKSIQHIIHKIIEERGARWCQMSEEEFCLIQVQLFDPFLKNRGVLKR